jgi:small subunit ribosomal protein S16
MVKIRLTRFGERNRVCYRLVAVDSRKKTNGGYLELLGTYDPTPTKSKIKDSKFKFNKERIFS